MKSYEFPTVNTYLDVGCSTGDKTIAIGKSKRHSLYNSDVSLDIKRIWLEQLESG